MRANEPRRGELNCKLYKKGLPPAAPSACILLSFMYEKPVWVL